MLISSDLACPFSLEYGQPKRANRAKAGERWRQSHPTPTLQIQTLKRPRNYTETLAILPQGSPTDLHRCTFCVTRLVFQRATVPWAQGAGRTVSVTNKSQPLSLSHAPSLSIYIYHEKPCKGFFSFILTNTRLISIDVTVEGDLATTSPFLSTTAAFSSPRALARFQPNDPSDPCVVR